MVTQGENMRTLQEIFDVVIEGGYYGSRKTGVVCDAYMCFALSNASGELITQEEAAFANSHIQKYLDSLSYGNVLTLKGALRGNNFPRSSKDLLAIYKDWETRPRLPHPPNQQR